MTRKIVATEYVTLDGFMDEPGEWSMPFWSDEAGQYKKEELFGFEAMLLGRRTYDGFSRAWPTMSDSEGFADKMNGMPKYVASRTPETATWNASILKGDVVEAVTELKNSDGGDLLLAGSGELLNLLAQHDLIDEYRLMVHPIVLGEGKKRLFTTAPRRQLELTGSVTFPTGVMVHTYRPVR
ncbi:dihydrofolate reductase family protein [Amycolatopsis sp. H20-H5]|uniref:dihydrofolate reductase family protein n=1 Tax=Amycolatopsis sp. H20-H5 TaxID=3046309 RepID=UPI002DBECE79|nr:dihydrofolate reductase family protein [Amycolatopsis sp. H20-H5]MEC3982464.1 dihydrofolate reductase family protein [Amycolatopsis sp. H20-H5]